MRTNKNYIPTDSEMKHLKETLHLLAAVTDDERFEVSYMNYEKEVPRNMCEVIDKYINIGVERGIEQGLEKGLFLSVKALMENFHLSAEQAMAALNISEKDQDKLKKMLS